jgi:hypothetical protein
VVSPAQVQAADEDPINLMKSLADWTQPFAHYKLEYIELEPICMLTLPQPVKSSRVWKKTDGRYA